MRLNKPEKAGAKAVDRTALVDITTVKVDTSLPREQMIADYLRQIKNPYLFLCGGVVVEIAYADTKETIEDKTEQFIREHQRLDYAKK